MKERGVIDPSTLPYSTPILLVPKVDGAYRFCVDFRTLNDTTITEILPLPTARECLDFLRGSNLFTTLGIYRQIGPVLADPTAKGHRHKAAF